MTTSRRLRQAPLSSAAAWIPSPGPWRRSGHGAGTSAASPGRPGGSAAAWPERAVIGAPGSEAAGQWRGGGEEALPGVGESLPGRLRPHPGHCRLSCFAQRGPSGPGRRLRLALAGREWRRLQEISNPRLGCSRACRGNPARSSWARGEARAAATQRNAGKNWNSA